jgi:alkylation response protein AidB-like acyl-CoA dehydrogenase
MICACNLSFSLYPGLTNGAWRALQDYADTDLKTLYFPKMAEGVWSGSMCLTEPHSGSDLGLLRTRAEPQEDGTYRISGTKIFITSGEHDLTENIIHLVLARTPGAPAGIKSISLFVVPKILPVEQVEPNSLSCGALEHKMGIKASATCVMNFDGAKGWLVGEVNKGASHVQDDEQRTLGYRYPGSGLCQGCLSECGGLCPKSVCRAVHHRGRDSLMLLPIR